MFGLSRQPILTTRSAFFLRNVSTTQAIEERKAMLDRMIRVDHAGEYGADRIYAGQMFVLGQDKKTGPLIQHMWDQARKYSVSFTFLYVPTRSSLK